MCAQRLQEPSLQASGKSGVLDPRSGGAAIPDIPPEKTDQDPFFVMDFIAGRPLDEYVRDEDLSVQETVRLFAKVCDAVNAAHVRGVVHRDLKPSNILVDEQGEPHVLDFGLSKITAPDDPGRPRGRTVTETGQFIGSLPWATPEQGEGASDKIDVRTDVYSLGLVLFNALTGDFPYEVTGFLREVLDSILNTEPLKPSTLRRDIASDLDTIVLKCLSKERERRYQTAGEVGREVAVHGKSHVIGAEHGNCLRGRLGWNQAHQKPPDVAVAETTGFPPGDGHTATASGLQF
jgi:serine/threonine protein kinase